MTPEQRKRFIFEALYGEQSGILRRYTAPEHLTPDRQRAEIMFMVDDLDAELPDLPDAEFAVMIERMHTHIRRNAYGRQWPTIAEFVKASRKLAGDPMHVSGGDVSKLTPDQKNTLGDVLAKAREWLHKPGLRQHAVKTLEYWGQSYVIPKD